MFIHEDHPECKKLRSIRQAIRENRAEREAIESALLPHDETRHRIKTALEKMWLPDHLFREFQQPDTFTSLPIDGKFPALSLIVYFSSIDEILNHIMAKMEADARPVGLPVADRAARIAAIDAEWQKLERADEIEALRVESLRLFGDGDIVERRGDANATVLLSVWGSYTEPAEAVAA